MGDYIGGNAVNVAVQLSRRGVQARYFGAVGDDVEGAAVRSALVHNGVDVRGLRVSRGPTAVTQIRVAGGERIFEHEDFGVTADYHPSTKDVAEIAAADWAHLGMLPGATELRRVLAPTRVVVSQDCAVAAGLDDLDVAFLSVGEGSEAHEELARVAAGHVPLVVVTMGADGSMAESAGTTWNQPALPTKLVDTTGAGDSFIAGFIAARLEGSRIPEALRAGAEYASATCGHLGGWPQCPLDLHDTPKERL